MTAGTRVTARPGRTGGGVQMRHWRGLLGFGALLVLLEIVVFVLVAYAIGALWAVLIRT